MQKYETEVLLLEVEGEQVPVELRIQREPDGDSLLPLDSDIPRTCDSPTIVVVDNAGRRGFVLITEGIVSDFDVEEHMRALKYIAPRMAERILPTLSPRRGPFDCCKEVQIDPDPERINASIELAAGETYEQRSRLCFDDTCREVLRIWRSTREGWSGPSGTTKEFKIEGLASSATKRRLYEKNEWRIAVAWGEGEGYWSYRREVEIPLAPGQGSSNWHPRQAAAYVINGGKMRELEEMLDKSQLGVMPEIVGEIEIGRDGFTFLDTPLREAVERDCREINVAAKAGAAKSVIVMCGSAIEAVLYAKLRGNDRAAKAKAGELAENGGDERLGKLFAKASKESVKRWGAEVIIHVAKALGHVSGDSESYAHALRDYRNLIHPGKEDRSTKNVTSHTAAIAMQVLNLVIRDVQKGSLGD